MSARGCLRRPAAKVNLAGVEIILNMREKMEAMQNQIENFVDTLNQELSQRATHRPIDSNSLIPVIQINSPASRSEAKRGTEGKRKLG